MNDPFFDEVATRKVSKRALVSSILAFMGSAAAAVTPLADLVKVPFLVVAIAVAVSALRTLNHPEARVIGGVRYLGVVLALLGAATAGLALVLTVLQLVRG
jgi:hypothetical protein